MVKLFSIYCVVSAVIYLIFGVFCVAKNKHSNVNRIWAFSSATIAIWSLGLGMLVRSDSLQEAHRWLTLHYFGAVLIPPTFLHYILLLVTAKKRKIQLFVWYPIFISFLFLNFFNQSILVTVSSTKPFFPYYTSTAPLYTFYTVVFFLCIVIAFAELIIAIAKARTIEKRNQYWYMFLATVFGFGGGSTAFFPVFDIKIYPIGMYFVVLYPALMTYAIIRHRLLDIEVIIKKTIVFAGLASSVFGVFALVTFFIREILSHFILVGSTFANIMSVILIVIGYEPLRKFLVETTDRYLFQKKINYRRLLKEASEYLAHVDSLRKQTRTIVAFLLKKARIANSSVYVFTSANPSSLALKASRPQVRGEYLKAIKLDHPLIKYLHKQHSCINISALNELIGSDRENQKVRTELEQIVSLMRALKAEAAVPCFSGKAAAQARKTEVHLKGILFLGHQKSDEPYSEDDLDVFFTLAQESSIAFENARLYDEAVERTKQLERTNIELIKVQSKLIYSLDETEKAKDEALRAKKKTEEMELELIRREKLTFVSALVKGISHEIGNPLQSMLYDLDELAQARESAYLVYNRLSIKENFSNKQQGYKNYDTIEKDVKSLRLLIRHIKNVIDTLNQLQQKDDQAIQPFDIKAFCEMVRPLIAMEVHGETFTDIPVKEDIAKGLPEVVGNSTQLTQVFINFFKNAAYAMNHQSDKQILISAKLCLDNTNFVEVRFSDNGCGISPDVLPKIFDFRFTTKGDKGQGIGLSQCKLIIEQTFKGSIRCQSELGKGTTFILQLPIRKGVDPNAN